MPPKKKSDKKKAQFMAAINGDERYGVNCDAMV